MPQQVCVWGGIRPALHLHAQDVRVEGARQLQVARDRAPAVAQDQLPPALNALQRHNACFCVCVMCMPHLSSHPPSAYQGQVVRPAVQGDEAVLDLEPGFGAALAEHCDVLARLEHHGVPGGRREFEGYCNPIP